MEIVKSLPDHRLTEVVRFFWYMQEHSEKTDFMPVLPFGALDIIIHLEDPMTLNEHFGLRQEPMAFVEGQYMKYQYKQPGNTTRLVGVSLQPWASNLLFDQPCKEFTGELVAINALKNPWLEKLVQQTRNSRNAEEAFAVLNSGFLSKLQDLKNQALPEVHLFSEALLRHDDLSIEEVAGKYWGRSIRSLQVNFLEVFGLTLSEFRRKKRFQKAMHLINQGGQSLTEVALESGFFDQAHFTRTFRSFTGIGPKQYRNQLTAAQPQTLMGQLSN